MFSSLKVLTKPWVWLQICVQSIAEKEKIHFCCHALSCAHEREKYFSNHVKLLCAHFDNVGEKRSFWTRWRLSRKSSNKKKAIWCWKLNFHVTIQFPSTAHYRKWKVFWLHPDFWVKLDFSVIELGVSKLDERVHLWWTSPEISPAGGPNPISQLIMMLKQRIKQISRNTKFSFSPATINWTHFSLDSSDKRVVY